MRQVGRAFPKNFLTPEGSTLCKQKARIIPPIITLLYTVAHREHIGPENEARAKAGTVSDADAWRLHLREGLAGRIYGCRDYCSMQNLTVDTGLSNGSWPIYVGFLSKLAHVCQVFRQGFRRVFAEHGGPFMSGFSLCVLGAGGPFTSVFGWVLAGFSWFFDCERGWKGGGGSGGDRMLCDIECA